MRPLLPPARCGNCCGLSSALWHAHCGQCCFLQLWPVLWPARCNRCSGMWCGLRAVASAAACVVACALWPMLRPVAATAAACALWQLLRPELCSVACALWPVLLPAAVACTVARALWSILCCQCCRLHAAVSVVAFAVGEALGAFEYCVSMLCVPELNFQYTTCTVYRVSCILIHENTYTIN